MRLLHTKEHLLHAFEGDAPPHAILSHTWGEQEVTFAAFQDAEGRRELHGWPKIQASCTLAAERGLQWIWIDTCCIDKSSSSELTEAINSMFAWYQSASICFAYLSDVTSPPSRRDGLASRWFTRGWTLQELLAPQEIEFFDAQWRPLGSLTRSSAARTDRDGGESAISSQAIDTRMADAAMPPEADNRWISSMISQATGIDEESLLTNDFTKTSIAERMSWAAKRQTTRPEDASYALMGLFNVNMPVLYGEGAQKAFHRLQLQILQMTDDESIFAWDYSAAPNPSPAGMRLYHQSFLSDSHARFLKSGVIQSITVIPRPPFQMTSKGLSIALALQSVDTVGRDIVYRTLLNCHKRSIMPLCVFVARDSSDGPEELCRIGPLTEFAGHDLALQISNSKEALENVFVGYQQLLYRTTGASRPLPWAAWSAKPASTVVLRVKKLESLEHQTKQLERRCEETESRMEALESKMEAISKNLQKWAQIQHKAPRRRD